MLKDGDVLDILGYGYIIHHFYWTKMQGDESRRLKMMYFRKGGREYEG